ncbi:hypothetical protein [Microbacterium arborescens]
MTATQQAHATTETAGPFAPLLALMDRFDAHLAEFQEAARHEYASTRGGRP